MDSQMTQYEENQGKVGRKFPSYSIRNEENQGKVGRKFPHIIFGMRKIIKSCKKISIDRKVIK
jgi:hypothetical protein